MSMFIRRASAAICDCTFMKTLCTSDTTANRTLMALIYLSFNYANIHAISPMIYIFFFIYTMDIFRTKTDIARILLEHECIFFG